MRDLRDLRGSIANLSAGNGQFGAALSRDDAYRHAFEMLRATDDLISGFNAGKGRIGELLRDPRLYESLNGSLRSLEELLRDFREHPQKYLRYQLFRRNRKRRK